MYSDKDTITTIHTVADTISPEEDSQYCPDNEQTAKESKVEFTENE